MPGTFRFKLDTSQSWLGDGNMWTREILGTDMYHLVSAFMLYSVLGWLVESIYMSICNRKFTNRGFAKGPFCPIYGFGAVICYLVLHPLQGNYIKIYLIGSILATIFEFLVGKLMLKLFGEVWWDYNNKPYNYKGLICLESSVAWGAYAVIIVMFLNTKVINFIDRYSVEFGMRVCKIVLVLASIDFIYHLLIALSSNAMEYRDKVIDKYQSIKARWY